MKPANYGGIGQKLSGPLFPGDFSQTCKYTFSPMWNISQRNGLINRIGFRS